MSLFQTSVLKGYLAKQEKEKLAKSYKKYVKYFFNPTIQENIRSSKEEQFQAKFLDELFVNVLDYSLKPKNPFNLVTEYKNQTNARKADGAILKGEIAIGVIELKGTNTKDLESIRKQAFDYKANQKGCVYVITSNFEKLRFYINDATEYEEFNLFELTKERFELFYLCLQKDNILNNLPLTIKEASIVQEEKITKDFYKDYSLFKRELYRDLVKRNKNVLFTREHAPLQKETKHAPLQKDIEHAPLQKETKHTPLQKETKHASLQKEKLTKLALFKKSQKLIDRFLFIFFAEDRGLLPANSTELILKKWKADVDFGDIRPLYNIFKLYFNFLDKGRQAKGGNAEIYAYNGGLFKEDSLLDSLEIDNHLLYKHTRKLAAYDFESQVDVNILGHIFENSLNEIESVNAEIEGAEFDKQKSKRKKDGVFYTPKYITKYIVENTVGKLCKEKKTELGIQEEEYFKGRKNRNKTTISNLVALLDTYREWLLQITICDPACGSGAFLNQALDFLIKEHTYIDELKTKVLGGGFQFPDIENTILENNIFGVDLNEESVEIAKLSLWLRTAQPRRKLNDLSANIKCGNSLIDSKTVAGNKAFNWQKQFPQVFKEKDKKIYHITTAIHDSRTSARMKKYKVRELREMGTNPYPNIIYFTAEDNLLITKTIAEIVKEDQLNLLAYNICADHLHLLLACDIKEIPAIMQKVKSITAKKVNLTRKNYTKEHITREHAPLQKQAPLQKHKNKPLWQQKYSAPKEVVTQEQLQNTINYIQKNRSKHQLPEHSKELKLRIQNMCCNTKAAFKTEYKGGFDVVIGNPPYVQLQSMGNQSENFKKIGYKTFDSSGDLYCLFYELGNVILKQNGLLGFITSNKWMRGNYGKPLRKYFLEETKIINLIDLGSGIFSSATVDSNIIITQKRKTTTQKIKALDISKEIKVFDFSNFEDKYIILEDLSESAWSIDSIDNQTIIEKINKLGTKLKDWNIEIYRGLLTGYNDAFIIDKKTKDKLIEEDPKCKEIIKPLLRGRDTHRYYYQFVNLWLINTHNGYKGNDRIDINNYPSIKKHLDLFWDKIFKRTDKGITPYNLRNCAYIDSFEKDKIIYPETTVRRGEFVFDSTGIFTDKTCFILTGENLKFLNTILASKLYTFYLENKLRLVGKTTIQYSKQYIIEIPCIEFSNNEDLIKKSDKMSLLNSQNSSLNLKFQTYLKQKFSLKKLSKKLQNWHELEFGDFIKELNKAIKTTNKNKNKELKPIAILTKKDEFEWLELFEENKQKAQELQAQINQTDQEIDQMVYKLYGLTAKEITIIENS